MEILFVSKSLNFTTLSSNKNFLEKDLNFCFGMQESFVIVVVNFFKRILKDIQKSAYVRED